MRAAALVSIAVLALLSPWQWCRAQTITLYRCTDAAGAVAFQDGPCGPGHEQQKLEMAQPQPPPEPPPPVVDPHATLSAEPAPPPEPLPAAPSRPPPPPLWRCRGLDKEPYFSEIATPPPRCLPLAAMGYDTRRLPAQLQGSCQNVYDQCVPLGGRELCRGWKSLLEQAQSLLRTAFSNTQAERQAEVDRLAGIIGGSRCR
ncbi:MAG TPA: DUF4124 domain-containing protein [Xanthomonadaceae bacterium]|nr:DUF4124 domain-containing protein [Xanthomonadaceae bacterium]